MEIKIIATTATDSENFENSQQYNIFSGKVAGVCYMPNTFNDLINESQEKTLKRCNLTKNNGHHSVFDHEYISLYIDQIPKLLAMILNNEKMYTTSEKSARYTIMTNCSTVEKKLYNKWYDIFVDTITKKYGGTSPFFDERRIKKLAQENARYFLSIYTPTSMVYTTSYRQLNYIAHWLTQLENNENVYLQKLSSYGKIFVERLKEFNLIDSALLDDRKSRQFSLFANRERQEEFGENYCTTYLGSFASLAQAQRHRTLSYEILPLTTPKFYIPEIIKNDKDLCQQWLNDMDKVKDIHPQAELVKINERGTVENFILKTKERLCSFAQLEIMRQTEDTLKKYHDTTTNTLVKHYLEKYLKGARCTSGEFKCDQPCMFKEGITLEREI